MHKKIFTDSVSVEQLEHFLRVSAKVVAMYGDTYLPIFTRMRTEVEKAKEAQQMKRLALQLAASYSNAE